jgi:hypothetical protein
VCTPVVSVGKGLGEGGPSELALGNAWRQTNNQIKQDGMRTVTNARWKAW